METRKCFGGEQRGFSIKQLLLPDLISFKHRIYYINTNAIVDIYIIIATMDLYTGIVAIIIGINPVSTFFFSFQNNFFWEVRMSNRKCLLTIASIIAMLSIAQSAFAASGSWTAGGATADPVDNTWGNIGVDPFTTGNWTGGIMANDVDSTATFNLDVGAGTLGVALGVAQPVTLENSYTVGNLIFGDTAPSTPGGWIVNETVINPDPNFYDASTLTLNVTPRYGNAASSTDYYGQRFGRGSGSNHEHSAAGRRNWNRSGKGRRRHAEFNKAKQSFSRRDRS